MPTVLRIGPCRFLFYASDGDEPIHVHVLRDDEMAKFWLQPVRLAVRKRVHPVAVINSVRCRSLRDHAPRYRRGFWHRLLALIYAYWMKKRRSPISVKSAEISGLRLCDSTELAEVRIYSAWKGKKIEPNRGCRSLTLKIKAISRRSDQPMLAARFSKKLQDYLNSLAGWSCSTY